MISLQQRILDVLGSQDSCLAADVYSSLGPNTERGAIDCALGGLVRSDQVSRENGSQGGVRYSLKFSGQAEEGVPTAEEEAALSLAQKLPQRACNACKVVKEITDFQLLANGQRRRRCDACRELTQPVIGEHVFTKLRNDQQNDLNRIAVLEAELAIVRIRTVRRQQFFQEYEALAEGVA